MLFPPPRLASADPKACTALSQRAMILRRLMLRQAGRRVVPAYPNPHARFLSTSPHQPIEHPFPRPQVPDEAHYDIPDAAHSEPITAAAPLEETWAQQTTPAVAKVVDDYLRKQYMRNSTGRLGSTPRKSSLPPQVLHDPPSPADVTLELLLSCGAHLGHKPSLWNPGNSQYILGVRDNIHIISLELTAAHLRRAAKVVEGISLRGGLILFVGTRRSHAMTVVKAAQLAGGCHLSRRWKPGTLTNGGALLKASKTMVVNERDEPVHGFEDQLANRATLKPDLVVCLNPRENWVLLKECSIFNIPTIGVVDTNTDPSWVTYPIPANDDSTRCTQTIAMVLGRAAEAGKEARLAAGRRGEILFNTAEGLMPLLREKPDSPADHRPLRPDVERYSR